MLINPWFWAFISMIGFHAAAVVVAGQRLGRNLLFTAGALVCVTVGRALLVMPFCPQPRSESSTWTWSLAIVFFVLTAFVGIPTLTVKWWRAPSKEMRLCTTGVYGLVRHPMYLSEILWPIGLSLVFSSVYGLLLTPVWVAAFYFHILIEETNLEKELGDEYSNYKRKVRSRLIPWLPF